jgi:serine/threonine protein kinase
MPASPQNPDQLEAGVRIGDFEIEKRLGAGGMGIVYQARQISLNRSVALKVLGAALTRRVDLVRFQREAQAVAKLKHPGIATLHFIGQDADLCYHVMELIEGVSLRAIIDRLAETRIPESTPDSVVGECLSDHRASSVRFDQPTTDHSPSAGSEPSGELTGAARELRRGAGHVRRCCQIVRDVARALAYAHEAGVIHRDIKPENLMLDRQGQVHIIDFGLARFFDDVSITNTGQLVGTPLYMSPEQVTGRIALDQRTDIYSLGLVLYELLTLRRPIDFGSRENLLRNIVTKALPPLCGRNPALPKTLEAVVHKATHKDPEERYQAAGELADELERVLKGESVAAPAYRYRLDLQEAIARRPSGVVLGAFLCFLVGCVGFLVMPVLGLMLLEDPTLPNAIVGLAVALLLCGGMGWVSMQLLAGRKWAWWLGIAFAVGLAGLVVTFSIASAVEFARRLQELERYNDPVQLQNFLFTSTVLVLVPSLLGLICAVTLFVTLLRSSTRAWYRETAATRREHAEMLRTLAD